MIKEVDQVQPHWQQVERDRSLNRRRHKFSYLKNSKSKPRDDDSTSDGSDHETSERQLDVRV
jgi:hypothetical protein